MAFIKKCILKKKDFEKETLKGFRLGQRANDRINSSENEQMRFKIPDLLASANLETYVVHLKTI